MSDKHRASHLAEMIVTTAAEKRAAGKARRAGPAPGAEPPRQVYMAALERIAQAFAPRGFRFARSGPHLTRVDGATRFRILFQADRNNVAGEHVRFWIHAGVENAEAERWLAGSEWPFTPTAQLGGGQIGNLRSPRGWWSWEIADPATRTARVDDAIAQIEAVILLFFERLSDPHSLAEQATHSEIPGVEDEAAVRLCYWQRGRAAAGQCLAVQVRRYGRLDAFRAERDRILDGGTVAPAYGDLARTMGAIAGTLRIALDL